MKSFEGRLAAMTQSENTEPGTVQCSHKQKFQRALNAAMERGIGRNTAAPPFIRFLAAVGLPVRPLHYMSTVTLFLFGATLGAAVFGGIYGSGLSSHFARGPLAGVEKAGWSGVAIMTLFVATGFAWLIRKQAVRYNLPRWSDL